MDSRGRLRAALLQQRRRRGALGTAAPRPRRGDGYEFAELREYAAGDDPRRIDWAATARAGTLQTRVLYEDRALTLAGAVDASASMWVGRARTAYDRGRDALHVWYGLATGHDRCVRLCSDGMLTDEHRRGRSAAHLCTAARDEPQEAFTITLRVALATVPRDASLLLVSDFYEIDDATPLLRALTERCDVTALVVRDPWHEGLPLGGFVRLRDAENGAVERVFIGTGERRRFAAALARRETRVRAALESAGVRTGVLAENPEVALMDAFAIL